jgi:hypothetical protein
MKIKNPPFTGKYSIKQVANLEDFGKLESVWNSLAEKQGAYEPFLCFDWFNLWLKHFLGDNRLLILLLYEENKIETIAPFLIKEEKFKQITVRKIDLIGNIYSPIRYFLFGRFDDKERGRNLYYIFRFLIKVYRNWDILDLYPIPDENNGFGILIPALKETGLKHSEYFCFGDWYSDGIECSGEEYLLKLPKRLMKDISYNQRRLRNTGKYEFRLILNGDISHCMDLYYGVYSKSWQKEENIGPSFHRDFAQIAAQKGWLRLGLLFYNEVAIASQLWLSCNNTAFIMKTVYDQHYKKYSPGKLLTAEMMKYVIDVDKVRILDYLHGDESYKEEWTTKRRERKGALVYNNTLKGNYLALLDNRILPLINKYDCLKKLKGIIATHVR